MAAIAPWFCLRLPYCGPGFGSQANHLHFFQFVLLKLYRENNKNKQKEAGIGPFLKKDREDTKIRSKINFYRSETTLALAEGSEVNLTDIILLTNLWPIL